MTIIIDAFTRADELLDANADWTKFGGATGLELGIVSNQVQTVGTSGSRRAYITDDSGDPDMRVQASVPALTNRGNNIANLIVLRYQDIDNFIGLGVSASNNAAVCIRLGGVFTTWDTSGIQGSPITSLRLEAEGTTVRAYYNTGSGFVLFHTQTSVVDLTTATLSGFVTGSSTAGAIVWDDYEAGTLLDYLGGALTGPAYVESLFDVDYFSYGTTYYFNPASTGGAGTGVSDANAFYTIAQVNAKNFSPGDKLLFRANSSYVVDEQIINDTMMGNGTDEPFYVGAYRMSAGSEVPGLLASQNRPELLGLPEEDWDPYGGMDNTDSGPWADAIPTPVFSGGLLEDGSIDGLWQLDGQDPLHIRIGDLAIKYSGGRCFQCSNGSGASTGGLLVENMYFEGSLKQLLHFGGVYDAIVQDCWFTLGGTANYYGFDPDLPAACGAKGREGDPDTPANITFRRNVFWDNHNRESINSNSGNRGVNIVDNISIDSGKVYTFYLERTHDMTVMRNIAIRTSREQWQDWIGVPEDGRGGVGIAVQNEKHITSFPWDEYDTEAEFFEYQTQRAIIAFNIVVGSEDGFAFLSQVSTASDGLHLGRAHGAGIYWYNNMSLDPAASHFSVASASPTSNYVLRDDVPQRVWGNIFWNGTTQANDNALADRNDTQFNTVFDVNYVEPNMTVPTSYDQNITQTGLVLPEVDYHDLSSLMNTDENDHMDYDAVRDFLDVIGIDPDDLSSRNLTLFKPLANVSSGLLTANLTKPPGNSWPYPLTDIEGQVLPTTLMFGPFAGIQIPELPGGTYYYTNLLSGSDDV